MDTKTKRTVLIASVLCIAVGFLMMLMTKDTQWSGVDETVVEKFAEEAGREARDPYINTDQGDILLFVFLLAGVAGGFVLGYYFREIFRVMKGCFALFSDYFALRDNVATRVDPRVKFVTAIGMIVSILLSTAFVWPLTVLCICVAAILGMRISLKIVILRMIPPMMIVAVIVLLRTFFVSGSILFEVDLGFAVIKASREGLKEGLLIGSKVTGSVSVILLLSFTTPAYKIFLSLLWMKVPNLWVETAMLMYRFIFALLEHTANVISAQKTRLGYINTKKGLSSVGTLAGAVLLGAIDQSQRTTDAMMLRCYAGQFVSEPLPPLKKTDILLALSFPVTAVVASFLIEGYIG